LREPDLSIPVLFIAGAQDPVTPPYSADEVAKHFVNSLVVRVPHGAHVLDGLTGLDTCLDAVMLRFFDRGSAREPDTSCFAQMSAPAFGASP